MSSIKPGLPFLIAAPTGAGKTTLLLRAIADLKEKFQIDRMVTYTTRPMRPNEVEGIDYNFVTKEQFLELQSQNHFFEVTTYNENCYGSPRSFIDQLSEGKSFMAITDRPGIVSYRDMCERIVSIWIFPPSIEVLSERLIKRGSESDAGLEKRLRLAREEMQAEIDSPLCEHHITNSDLEVATQDLIDIVTRSLNE
jgi:guanylate kinase